MSADTESSGEESDDLHTRLHAMESKLKRMADQRAGNNDNARAHADQRNTIQEQYKELRDRIKEKLAEQKEIRAEAKTHQARRDAIQEQLRGLFSRSKGARDKGKGQSVVVQLSEKRAEMDNLERRLETDSTVTIAKEKQIFKQLKSLREEVIALEPMVSEEVRVKIDLDDLDGSIEKLRAEADMEHEAMVKFHTQADELWTEIEPLFADRDFLKAEGDRLHSLFVASREAADEVHQAMQGLIEKVTEIRDELKQERAERQAWIDDHNREIEESSRKPTEDEELADSLISQLLAEGSLSLGAGGAAETERTSPKKKRGKRAATPRRGGPRRRSQD